MDNDLLWFAKWRPQYIDDMTLQFNTRVKLEEYLEKENIPHLLFYGDPGSGKTTIGHILIKELHAQKIILNAGSVDRGIAAVKGKIKDFARSESRDESLKIVFLDEADGMTPEAQVGLKNTMETYSSNCRFILTANNLDKVDYAIRSRCTLFELKSYDKGKLFTYMDTICQGEGVKYVKEEINILIDAYYPDIRSIINNLQLGTVDDEFSLNNLDSIIVDKDIIKKLLLIGNVRKLRELWNGVTNFTFYYKYLFDEFLFEIKIGSNIKSEIALEIAEFMYRDKIVVDREINFTACCISVMGVMKIKLTF
jgi:replication factor C small subunit